MFVEVKTFLAALRERYPSTAAAMAYLQGFATGEPLVLDAAGILNSFGALSVSLDAADAEAIVAAMDPSGAGSGSVSIDGPDSQLADFLTVEYGAPENLALYGMVVNWTHVRMPRALRGLAPPCVLFSGRVVGSASKNARSSAHT